VVAEFKRGSHIVLVDSEDSHFLQDYTWYVAKEKTGRCYVRVKVSNNPRKRMFLHRLIMKPASNEEVDHINHNGLDCRKINLRNCTRAQNARNTRKCKPKTSSKYKGVTFNRGGWQAQATMNGIVLYLGRFRSEIEAAIQYDKFALLHYGEFARTNF